MFIFGTRKISVLDIVKGVSPLVFASLAFQVYAQSTANNPPPASVTVQTSEATLAAPPPLVHNLVRKNPLAKQQNYLRPLQKQTRLRIL